MVEQYDFRIKSSQLIKADKQRLICSCGDLLRRHQPIKIGNKDVVLKELTWISRKFLEVNVSICTNAWIVIINQPKLTSTNLRFLCKAN